VTKGGYETCLPPKCRRAGPPQIWRAGTTDPNSEASGLSSQAAEVQRPNRTRGIRRTIPISSLQMSNSNAIVEAMRNATPKSRRTTRSFSIDPDVHAYVVRTRGTASASERVNQMLQKAIERESDEQLETEAARFFSAPRGKSRKEERAFQKATKRSLSRE